MINISKKGLIDGILKETANNIFQQTGLHVSLSVNEKIYKMPGSCEEMMGLIAQSLGGTMDDYYGGSKKENVDLRCIAVLFIRKYYAELTLLEIAAIIDVCDHSYIIRMTKRAQDYLDTGEPKFMIKYETVSKAIMKWIKE